MQGSGTFGNESVIQTTSSECSHYLILENGAYGLRLHKICKLLKIKSSLKSFDESRSIDLNSLEQILKSVKHNEYTHVAVIQNETTSGVLNDVKEIGHLVKKYLPGLLALITLFTNLD
jgi:2-aminoethylphosphonate-pyruvate transaminase